MQQQFSAYLLKRIQLVVALDNIFLGLTLLKWNSRT